MSIFHFSVTQRLGEKAILQGGLEIIGEAATSMPEDIKEQYPDIPWHQMIGMRNILIHEYFGVDIDVLWRTIQVDLPILLTKVRKILEE